MLKKELFWSLLLTCTTLTAGELDGKSADDIAKELANPNTPLTSLRFRLQHFSYEGDLPNANSQSSTLLNLQPTLPFPLDNGHNIWVRPSIPLIFDQPSFNTANQTFDSTFGLADIVFDVQYGKAVKQGFLWSAGGSITLPTATDESLGSNKWSAGPGFQIGHMGKKSVLGTFINHQWDFAGSGDNDVSLTTTQLFAVYLPGGGWNIGSVPVITYDHEKNETTLPLNVAIGRTVVLNERPWKFSLELNYYVEQPDSLGPQWMIGFNIAPVVKNKLVDWFK